MKIVLIILGVIIMLAGGGCAAAAGAGAAFVGPDGWIDSDEGRLDTTTHALVSDVAVFTEEEATTRDLDRFDIELRARAEPSDGETPIFIGVAPSTAVDTYLAGVTYDLVANVEFDPLQVDKARIEGTRDPEPPTEQNFWSESIVTDSDREFEWDVESGSYRFVLMNADASEGVDAEASLGVRVPFLFGAALGVAIAGFVFFLAGIGIIVLAVRSMGRSSEPAPPPGV